MRILVVAAVASFVVGMAPAGAAPAFNCTGAGRAEYKTVCADPELVRLDRALDAAVGRRIAAADPLTAMLLRRDQRWFAETLGAQNMGPFAPDDPQRQRILDALRGRQATIEQLNVGAVDHPAGQWANAFSTARVEQGADGALAVEVVGGVAYAEGDDTCGARSQVKPDAEGWFAGPAVRIGGEDAAAGSNEPNPFRFLLRLQGNTLRIVLTLSEQDTICGTPEQVTGTYFAIDSGATGRSPPAAVAARTVSPSFSCASAKNVDEEEICADPELAARDADVARAYRDALRMLDSKSGSFLRDDQRAFVKANAIAFAVQLHPSRDKRTNFVHQTGNARDELFLRLSERLAMLVNLEPARRGTAGLWLGHNAMLGIVPHRDYIDMLQATGQKWQTGDDESHCDFKAEGRLAGGVFRAVGSFPALARDGATLTIDGKDSDQTRDRNGNRKRKQPGYCTRMDSAKARLFPVKAGAAIDRLERIR